MTTEHAVHALTSVGRKSAPEGRRGAAVSSGKRRGVQAVGAMRVTAGLMQRRSGGALAAVVFR